MFRKSSALEFKGVGKKIAFFVVSEKGCKAISVITGRGNNSRGGKARIKPAILEYLKKNNYV